MSSLPAIDGGSPVRQNMLPFGVPAISDAEIQEVVETLRSGWIGTGPRTAQFEQEFAEYVGARHAVATNSCTAALHLSLLAIGCGPGDEVVTSALTFVATANAITHTGARVVLADVDPMTFNITVDRIEQCLSRKTKVILPVHFGGLPCELDAIYALATERGIQVIEDCAHAVGAEYRGKRVGGFPGLSCFSFYANKNLTTGEGGMITTGDPGVAERVATWRLHGLDRDAWRRFHSKDVMMSWCQFPGFKYNMPDVLAAIGLHQLRRLPEMLETRERYATLLDEALEAIPGLRRQYRPKDRREGRHALHLYVVTVDPQVFRVSRDYLVAALRAEGIGAAIHYEPVHRHPYYRELLGVADEQLPNASSLGSTVISLPLSPAMSESDLTDVVDACIKVFGYYRR